LERFTVQGYSILIVEDGGMSRYLLTAMFPDMDGFEFCGRAEALFRENAILLDTPVETFQKVHVLMTSSSGQDDRVLLACEV
jgi:PleD family two-component response regulator